MVELSKLQAGEHRYELSKADKLELSKAVAAYNRAYERENTGLGPVLLFSARKAEDGTYRVLLVVRSHVPPTMPTVYSVEEIAALEENRFYPGTPADVNRLRGVAHKAQAIAGKRFSVRVVDGGAIVSVGERTESLRDWILGVWNAYEAPVRITGNLGSVRATLSRMDVPLVARKVDGDYWLVKK
jgi:hypothetical protein